MGCGNVSEYKLNQQRVTSCVSRHKWRFNRGFILTASNTHSAAVCPSMTAILPRLFGVLFYYSPISETAQQVLPILSQLPTLLETNYPPKENDCLPDLSDLFLRLQCAEPNIYDFSVLFEGQGQMPAPPWGSVYLDKENLLMGESTLLYRRFLAEQQLKMTTGMNEPEDQFGLMLLALAYFVEDDNELAVNMLLEVHLFPWAFRYLECLEAAPVGDFYRILGKLVRVYFNILIRDLDLTIMPKKTYF